MASLLSFCHSVLCACRGLTLPCCHENPEGISPILYRGDGKHPSDDNIGTTVSLGGRIQKDSMHTTPENCLHLPRQESEL